MSLKELFLIFYTQKFTGKEIDKCLLVFLGNLIKSAPVISITLESTEHLARMIQDSDSSFIFFVNNHCCWCAYYKHSDDFPLSRIYLIGRKDMTKWTQIDTEINEYGHKLSPINPKEFSDLIEDRNYLERINKYKSNLKNDTELYKGLVEGRAEATVVNQGFYLKTNKCLICGNKIHQTLSSTIGNEDYGLMIGYNLCIKHKKEADQESSYIEYLNQKLNIKSKFKTEVLTQNQIIYYSTVILNNKMNCSIDEIKNNTIKATRIESGFIIRLRLDSVMNYGYMIYDKHNVQLARFDSANHHNVNYGPDHVHRNLRDKKVESSFTYGLPIFDYESLLKLIEQHEKNYNKAKAYE